MATTVIMPRQGQSVESCIITRLFVNAGDPVESGDLLFAYETDKAAFEEASPVDGVLLSWLFEEGDEVPVLQAVCIIGSPDEEVGPADPGNSITLATDKPIEEGLPGDTEPGFEGRYLGQQVELKASPRARIIARENNMEVSSIRGTGPGGRIIARDVLSVIEADRGSGYTSSSFGEQEDEYRTEHLSKVRKLIAGSMLRSLTGSAQLTHHMGADASGILELRKRFKEMEEYLELKDVTINDMVCFAVVRALRKHPAINAHYTGESLKIFQEVNLGVAVDTERGLMVPVVRKASSLSLAGLSENVKSITRECRKGSVNPDLLQSGSASFTITNLGSYGIEMFTPILNLPQVAILGVNTILPRAVDTGEGRYEFVPHIGLSLTYDHRALDGAEASRFLREVTVEIAGFGKSFQK